MKMLFFLTQLEMRVQIKIYISGWKFFMGSMISKKKNLEMSLLGIPRKVEKFEKFRSVKYVFFTPAGTLKLGIITRAIFLKFVKKITNFRFSSKAETTSYFTEKLFCRNGRR